VFLQFLYQNKVELSEPLAMELYELSDKYLQTELAELCEEFLSINLRLDNLSVMVNFAEKFETPALKEAILEFMARNLEEIQKDQSDYAIPPPYIWEMGSKLKQKLEKK